MTATEPSWDLTALDGVWGERNVDTVDRGRTMEGVIVYLVTTHRKGTMQRASGKMEWRDSDIYTSPSLSSLLSLHFSASLFHCLHLPLGRCSPGWAYS